MGTLIGKAVRGHSYEYLTSLLRVMMHVELEPNDTILEMLDYAASREAKVVCHHWEVWNISLGGGEGLFPYWCSPCGGQYTYPCKQL